MKTVLTVKSSKNVATLINCINYTFNTIIIKQITECDTLIAVIVTFFTNLFGVYFALWLLDVFKKDKVWKITVTIKDREVLYETVDILEHKDISYAYTSIYYSRMKKGGRLEIFAKTKEESKEVGSILEGIHCKYDVMEIKKTEL